jgi:hypothetical protein
MNSFTGKKALCFIALPHHNRFLVPIMDALRDRGMETVYFTAAAEGAFEITLNQANLPYRHVLDYASQQTSEQVGAAYRKLAEELQEKILANRTLQSVPLVIQDKVIRSAVENYYCIDRMLQAEKPDVLFALHELNPWGKILGYLSHVHRIPYFTLQEGLYYCDVHYYRFHTDFSTACLVWGEDCRDILLRAGCSDDKIFPVGNTHIWNAKTKFAGDDSVQATRAALGIGRQKKIVLFLMSHSHYQPFDADIFLRWMKARGDVMAVFKWHPVTGKEIVDRALGRVPKDAPVISVHDFDTYALIGASDVCVTVGNSTTGLEALVFGKPLIEVRLPDQDYSYSLRGVAESARGFEDIGEKAETIFSHGLSPERALRVRNYLTHNFAYQDDGAIERIVNLVDEGLGARAQEAKPGVFPRHSARFPCSIILPVDDSEPQILLDTLEAISAHTAPDLFEIVLVNCARRQEICEILDSLDGDVRVVKGEPAWSYSVASNHAMAQTAGEYLVFIKPGLLPHGGWLTGLLDAAEAGGDNTIAAAQTLNPNGLLRHLGVAFDVNQSPFSIYRLLPTEFSGAQREREFKAVEVPFLISREIFCRLGGFSTDLHNRFEDIDFCLKARQAGIRILSTPRSRMTRQAPSWLPAPDQDLRNRVRFYSRWTGFLWQDDGQYLQEDGLTHDTLSSLYRELAGRVASGAREVVGHLQNPSGDRGASQQP